MQSRIQDFEALDTVVMAISVDSVDKNREIAASHCPDILLLSDPGLAAVDAYGLRHVGAGLDGDIARPATFVIDRRGQIAWRDLTENWRVRPRPDRILEVLAGLEESTPVPGLTRVGFSGLSHRHQRLYEFHTQSLSACAAEECPDAGDHPPPAASA